VLFLQGEMLALSSVDATLRSVCTFLLADGSPVSPKAQAKDLQARRGGCAEASHSGSQIAGGAKVCLDHRSDSLSICFGHKRAP